MHKNETLALAKEAAASGNEPRIHPNGFIQLDLDEYGQQRLHVWRNDLPRQKVYTPVHNHRFDFTSVTIAGALTNIKFELGDANDGPRHRVWEVRRDLTSQETQLVASEHLIGLVAVKVSLISPGEGYEFFAGDFHETGFVHNTVTVINKTEPIAGINSAVLVPEGIEPDNSFTRALPSTRDIIYKITDALS